MCACPLSLLLPILTGTVCLVGQLIIESTAPSPGLLGELEGHRIAVWTLVKLLTNHSTNFVCVCVCVTWGGTVYA